MLRYCYDVAFTKFCQSQEAQNPANQPFQVGTMLKMGKGYATVIAELWDQCRRLGVALPQPQPVAASSITKARARVHEDMFRDLHREILAHDPHWNGHRTFAIDGSRLNLPRPLAEDGYALPNDGAHSPQGLLSCKRFGPGPRFSIQARGVEPAAP